MSKRKTIEKKPWELVMSDESNIGLDDMLFKVKYKTDDAEYTHLKIKDQEACRKCEDKPCIPRCPAQVYEYEDDHTMVAYENCLECGVCKIVCPYDNIDWEYPRGGFGVVWKFG